METWSINVLWRGGGVSSIPQGTVLAPFKVDIRHLKGVTLGRARQDFNQYSAISQREPDSLDSVVIRHMWSSEASSVYVSVLKCSTCSIVYSLGTLLCVLTVQSQLTALKKYKIQFKEAVLNKHLPSKRPAVQSIYRLRYVLDDGGIGVRFPAESRHFLFSIVSRPALESTQLPVQWVLGALSSKVKRLGREADH
jgi:hypothetical protein